MELRTVMTAITMVYMDTVNLIVQEWDRIVEMEL